MMREPECSLGTRPFRVTEYSVKFYHPAISGELVDTHKDLGVFSVLEAYEELQVHVAWQVMCYQKQQTA